jgi:transketolase
LDHRGPIYIRLAKGGDPVVTNDKVPFRIGKSLLMREGRDALLVTTGVTLKIALDAAEMLSRSGIEAAVLHMPTVKPLDEEAFLDHASRSRVIVAVEENTIIGGLGSALAEAISEAGFNPARKFKRIGVPDRFPDKYGSQANLLDYYGINAQQVAATVESLTGRRQAGRYA